MLMENLEKAHYLLQKGILFTGSKKISEAELLYSDAVTDSYWNYATSVSVRAAGIGKLLDRIAFFYTEMKGKPAVYLTHGRGKGIDKALIKNGFRLKYTDSWMVYAGRSKAHGSADIHIERVSTRAGILHFIKIFETVYGLKGTGPYKGLQKGYAKALLGAYGRRYPGKSVAFYLAYTSRKPVGCAMLITSGRYAGLYGLGVLQGYRGRGIARALTAGRISDAREMGASTIFLQTERGSINEKIFRRMGFRTEFVGRCFVKSEGS